MNTAIWIVQILAALAFGMAGFMKLTQPHEKLVTNMKWVEDFAPNTIKVIGALELLGAIGLILPALTGILPSLTALAGVGLVLVVPFTYGARKVFFLMEDFVTPRLLAEALVVAGLAAFLHRRHWLAAVLAALAASAAHAQVSGIGGLGLMGDSLSDEYAEESYGSYADNWAEQIELYRGIPLGPTASEAGVGDWGEQRIAESIGKVGRGILPVVLESADAPGAQADDVLLAVVGDGAPARQPSLGVTGPLGAQFLGWEYATAVAGRILGINPFDQPNVTESKDNTNRILGEGLPADPPAAKIGAIEIRGSGGALDGVDLSAHDGVVLALDALLSAIPPRGYLAVMAYLDREQDAAAGELRALLARRTEHAVTFGWGPRFLHSTGQYHKGGPQVGAFLQVTGVVDQDLPVPDRDFDFATLQAAQAAGDRKALADRGRPLLHLHLTDRAAGLAQLRDVLA